MSFQKRLANPYYRSLYRNIILTIISVSMIPMVLVSSTIYLQFRSSYHEKVYAHLQELVQKHTQNIDTFLNERLSDIKFLAGNLGYDQLKFESFLREKLEVLQRDFGPVFVDLGVINARGEQIAYAGPFKLAQANYSEAEWFRESMQRRYYISDVFMGLRGLPHFIVAVRSTFQDSPWILRATIDFVAFNNLVKSIHLGQTGFAFILNRQGALQTTPLTKPSGDLLPNKAIHTKFLEKAPASPVDICIVLKPNSFRQKNIYVGAFLKNGQWLLIYQQRTRDAFADLNKTFVVTTVIMLVGTFGVVVMAFTLSKLIVNRIAKADDEKQMMNQKVVEAGKLASVGELAAGVAHEINNPVAIMVEEAGWIGDLLEEEEFRQSENLAELTRAINQIQTQGKRCKEITHKLLSFARKTDSTIQDVDVNELLEDVVALTAQRAKYSMVQIKSNFDKSLPALKVSPSEIQQVFFNLINNALDAMDSKGGTLTISSRQHDEYLIFEIADTGKGIPEANLNRIFDPFFTTKSVGKGTGLGLSICYGIIEKLGGKIECKSAVDVGTTFYVYIPLRQGTGG
ncbi:MAG: GHKL domain-containing protein [Desulfobacterales bacterium]|nr:MAG: GHKL domain-containing protein [Desulfobacterales bacterium]